MAFRRGRWVTVVVAAGAAAIAGLAVVLALQPSMARTIVSVSAEPGAVKLSAAPLGVNVGPWDGAYAGAGRSYIQPLLSAAGIRQLRYGGGSYADYYDWQTNTDIGRCLPYDPTASFTSPCATPDKLDFAMLANRAAQIGADSLVTVNYGSGTPALAAAWVKTAASTAGEHVALWEVGNENYICGEVNNELSAAPAHYEGYRPATPAIGDDQTCPQTTQGPAAGTRTLATSYADNALPFLKAMKAADPAAVIGVPWAFPNSMRTYSVADSNTWNNTVLGTDGAYVGFVDAHFYPYSFSGSTGGSNPTATQVLQSLRGIPSLAASIKSGLAAHDPGAAMVIGETAVSSGSTTTVCTPLGAVFAAGDVLSWLAAGAQSVDWWDMNNNGNTGSSCVNPDFGLFTSGAKPIAETPYYGYLLSSFLAQPGAYLAPLTTSRPGQVLAFQSALPNGKHAVAFINLNTSVARTVTFPAVTGLAGTLHGWRYGADGQNATRSTVIQGAVSAASLSKGITLPRESITVLETQ